MSRIKDLNYYLQLDYPIIIEKEYQDGETWYICYCNELGKNSCYGIGDAQQEAMESFFKEKESFIKFLFSKKITIPEPRELNSENELLSGTFNVRTSPQLHSLLSCQAKSQGISLNQYVNQILASASTLHDVKKYFETVAFKLGKKIENHHQVVTKQMTAYTMKLFKESTIYDVNYDFSSFNFKQMSA